MSLAPALVLAIEIYLGVGLVFGIAFAFRWVERVDPAAHGGTRGFRILILPGCAALWPWLLLRLARARGGAR